MFADCKATGIATGIEAACRRVASMTLNAAAIVVLAAFGAGGVQSAHAQDADAGRIKARMCQTCHGLDGIAKIPLAPHIAGESEIYLRTRLEAYRSGDMEHEMMSLIAKPLSDEDIADLAAWYASVRIDAQIPE